MKKVLAILAITGSLVACNNSGEGSGNPDSLNNVNPDSNTTNSTINSGTTTGTGDSLNSVPVGTDTLHRNGADSVKK
jgi:hypothetical protein